MKEKYIVISSLLACCLLYYVEQVLAVDYVVKTLCKIALFVAIPYCYRHFMEQQDGAEKKKPAAGSLKSGLFFGMAAFAIISVAYGLFQNALDLPAIAQELQQKSKITPANFLLVGSYITLGNSLLEELFFRGFIFLSLYKLGRKRWAYCYSSLLFAVYHIAIFRTWFTPGLMVLALLSLVAVGFIFNWLNAKSGNWLNSWLAP